jgi:DNA-binding CsgD family transcriptional regulator/PAS domain-containing protein
MQCMMNLEAFSRVTTGIYDAAIEPARWDGALRAIQDLFRGSAVSLIERDLTTMGGHWLSTHDPETERDFFGPWRHRNIFAQSVVGRSPRPVETDRDMLPKAELLNCEYYVDFLRPRDLHAILMLWLPRLGSAQPSLSIARSASAGEFELEDVEFGRLLRPHIERALTVQRRLRRTDLAGGGAAAALDRLCDAVLILDESACPLHLNRAAERLLADADGLSLNGGVLRAATPRLSHLLDAVLSRASGRTCEPAASGALTLSRRDKPNLMLIAVPVRAEVMGADIPGSRPRRPAICLCVFDPLATPAIPATRLVELFDFTPAEAAIGGDLIAGHEARRIAERRGLSYNTVRNHVARMMSKAGTTRQVELVSLLLRVARLGAEK